MTHTEDTFETLHSGLTVELIETPRADLVTCHPQETVADVLDRNEAGNGARRESYDYLPAEAGGEIVGLFRTMGRAKIPPTGGQAVETLMDPLSPQNLIGRDGTILDFLREVHDRPYRLVVSGNGISGLVTWSDLQKLPVRAALFGLITGLEMEMSHAIRREYPLPDVPKPAWMAHVTHGLENLCKRIKKSKQADSEVDALLHTNLGQKATILDAINCPKPWADTAYRDEFREIKQLRNEVAHAMDYATSLEEANHVGRVVRNLFRIRGEVAKWRTRLEDDAAVIFAHTEGP